MGACAAYDKTLVRRAWSLGVKPLDVLVLRHFVRDVREHHPEARTAAEQSRQPKHALGQPPRFRVGVIAGQHILLHPFDGEALCEVALLVAVLVSILESALLGFEVSA